MNYNHTDLTHWGRATHICVSKFTITASDNGLMPGRRQAIIWNNAGILSIGPLGTNFSEILIEILTFSFKEMRLKVSSAKWRPFCLGLNVLTVIIVTYEWIMQYINSGCPAVREKSGKFQTWQKSGKSQGILLKVREKVNIGKSQGKVREFAFSAI